MSQCSQEEPIFNVTVQFNKLKEADETSHSASNIVAVWMDFVPYTGKSAALHL